MRNNFLLDILFPKRCVGCGRLGSYFCPSCSSIIRIIEPSETICPMCEKPAIGGITHLKCQTKYGIDGLTSFFHYDGVIKKAVKTLKYRFVSDIAKEFVGLALFLCHLRESEDPMRRWIPDQVGNDNEILVPIPLYPARLKERGFNQAEKLGYILADQLHMSLNPDILLRTKKTEPQATMKHRKDRLRNMDNVFALQRTVNSELSTILLFDDVFTTGATMRAAANVLKHGGIKRVWAVTMAR